jgi:hypothetical protein
LPFVDEEEYGQLHDGRHWQNHYLPSPHLGPECNMVPFSLTEKQVQLHWDFPRIAAKLFSSPFLVGRCSFEGAKIANL